MDQARRAAVLQKLAGQPRALSGELGSVGRGEEAAYVLARQRRQRYGALRARAIAQSGAVPGPAYLGSGGPPPPDTLVLHERPIGELLERVPARGGGLDELARHARATQATRSMPDVVTRLARLLVR